MRCKEVLLTARWLVLGRKREKGECRMWTSRPPRPARRPCWAGGGQTTWARAGALPGGVAAAAAGLVPQLRQQLAPAGDEVILPIPAGHVGGHP